MVFLYSLTGQHGEENQRLDGLERYLGQEEKVKFADISSHGKGGGGERGHHCRDKKQHTQGVGGGIAKNDGVSGVKKESLKRVSRS